MWFFIRSLLRLCLLAPCLCLIRGADAQTLSPQVQTSLSAGQQAARSGRFDAARRYLETAWTQARAEKKRSAEAFVLEEVSGAFAHNGQPRGALAFYARTLALYRKRHDREMEFKTLLLQGYVYKYMGQPQNVAASAEQALAISRKLKDTAGEITANHFLGEHYLGIRQPKKALPFYERERVLAHARQDRRREASALRNIGRVYADLGDPLNQVEILEQAERLYSAIQDPIFIGVCLMDIGALYQRVGQPQKALASYLQARTFYHDHRKQTQDWVCEAQALSALGSLYEEQGQLQTATEQFEEALNTCLAIPESAAVAGSLYTTGYELWIMRRSRRAIPFVERALNLCRESRNEHGEREALDALAWIYQETGKPKEAQECYERKLALDVRAGNRSEEANTLADLGRFSARTGEPEKAAAFYERALNLWAANDRDWWPRILTLGVLGDLYERSRQYDLALQRYQQALALSKSKFVREGQDDLLARIGSVNRKRKHPAEALDAYSRALLIAREYGDREREAALLSSMSQVEAETGSFQKADAHSQQAIQILEALRLRLGQRTASKVAFLETNLAVYHQGLRLRIQQGKIAEAFALVQQTKARALLDVMAGGNIDLTARLPEAERRSLVSLSKHAEAVNRQMIGEGVKNEVGSKRRYEALREEAGRTEQQLQTLSEQLFAAHPEFAQQRAAHTATSADVIRFLPRNTALLEYVTLPAENEDRVDVLLFVVADGSVTVHSLPLTGEALEQQADALRMACADPRKPYQEAAERLYTQLLRPAEGRIAGKRHLILCPDGCLWDIPFAVLSPRPGQHLIEQGDLTYAYSATGALASVHAHRAAGSRGSILVLANPDFGDAQRYGDPADLPGQRPIDRPSRPFDSPSRPFDTPSRDLFLELRGGLAALEGAQREADALQRLFPDAAVFTGKQAQESLFKQEAGKYRYLHLATHAFFNDAAPFLSSVFLAVPASGSREDGFLTAREIVEMKLNAEIAVLSACQTGRGAKRSGEGIIGLTWALFVAGCPAQVLSQWSVDDAATASLMEQFYIGLKAGKNKGTSLREASLSLLHADVKYSHPYYWAPFFLIGDWQ